MAVKKRLQPKASATNFVDLPASMDGVTSLTTCKYAVTVNYGSSFTALVVKVDGVNTTKTISANSKKTLRTEVQRVLRELGYDPHYTMDNIVGVRTNGNDLVVIGEAELVSVTNGTSKAFTKACTPTRMVEATYTLAVDAADVPVSLNEAAATEMAGPFNTGEASALVTALETALDTQGVVYTIVSATEADGDFTITIHMTSDAANLSIGGVVGNEVKIYQDYL